MMLFQGVDHLLQDQDLLIEKTAVGGLKLVTTLRLEVQAHLGVIGLEKVILIGLHQEPGETH